MLTVVAFGDSLTEGQDTAEGKNYPYTDFLHDKLQDKVAFTNKGIGGDLTTAMVNRLQADVLDQQPDVAIVLGGANDIGWEIPSSQIIQNLEEIYRQCQEKGIIPVACAIPPLMHIQHLNMVRKEVNEKLSAFAKEKGFPFVDLYAPLADPQADDLQPKFSSDGLHLNREGYYEIGRVLYDTLFSNTGYFKGRLG